MNLMNLMYYYIFYCMNSFTEKLKTKDKKVVIENAYGPFYRLQTSEEIEKGLKEEEKNEKEIEKK